MSAMGTFVQTRFLHGIPFFVRFLTVALLGGGLIGGIANFLLQKSLWVWVMPDLAHRFLAAAAFGYVVGSVVALTRTRWAESELLLVTVVLYGVPLIAAILLQADVIDWGRPVAWAFVAIVSQAMVISLVYLWRNHDRAEREEAHPLSATLRVYLVAVGLLALVVGVIVYVAPKQSGFLWPWAELRAWKPLDGRLIASMLVTLGGGALLVAWRDDRGGGAGLLRHARRVLPRRGGRARPPYVANPGLRGDEHRVHRHLRCHLLRGCRPARLGATRRPRAAVAHRTDGLARGARRFVVVGACVAGRAATCPSPRQAETRPATPFAWWSYRGGSLDDPPHVH